MNLSRWLERILVIVGVLLVGSWAKLQADAKSFESSETRKLEAAREVQRSLSSPRVAMSGGRRTLQLESGVLGRIEIPRLGISALITEGVGSDQLDRGVGHIPSSAFPGLTGNCALAGHRDSFLRGLGEVREGDLIRVETIHDTYTYRVQWNMVVVPEQVEVLDPTPKPALTLVTCYPFDWVGPAPDRFVVRADLAPSKD